MEIDFGWNKLMEYKVVVILVMACDHIAQMSSQTHLSIEAFKCRPITLPSVSSDYSQIVSIQHSCSSDSILLPNKLSSTDNRWEVNNIAIRGRVEG